MHGASSSHTFSITMQDKNSSIKFMVMIFVYRAICAIPHYVEKNNVPFVFSSISKEEIKELRKYIHICKLEC